MGIKRAGLYERVSTDEQAKYGYSIKTQIDALEEHCEKNQMKVVDHYTDDGVSGGKAAFKRPEMSRLLEDVKAGKIDIVLFTRLDRWFRNVKEYFKVQEILEEHGVEWKAIWEDYTTSSANGRMAITIFLSINQHERERGAERITSVLENKRKNREACFGGPIKPFGYMKVKEDDGYVRLHKDPGEQEACQAFWDILRKTNNLSKAMRHMALHYDIRKNWKTWKRITQSDFYCGVYKGVLDYCEPYISQEDWLKVQERSKGVTTKSERTYLFRGLMRCSSCGHKLCGDSTKKAYGTYKAYRCVYRYRGCDNGLSMSEKKLEKYLLARLEDLLRDEIAKVELEQSKPKPKPKSNVKSLKEKQRRLTVAYMAGNIPDDEYLRDDAELKALIAKAEAEAPPPERDITPLKELLELDFKTIYEGLTDEEKQRFWTGLISEIVVEGKQIKEVKFF